MIDKKVKETTARVKQLARYLLEKRPCRIVIETDGGGSRNGGDQGNGSVAPRPAKTARFSDL